MVARSWEEDRMGRNVIGKELCAGMMETFWNYVEVVLVQH